MPDRLFASFMTSPPFANGRDHNPEGGPPPWACGEKPRARGRLGVRSAPVPRAPLALCALLLCAAGSPARAGLFSAAPRTPPPPEALGRALLEAVAASCPGARVSLDADLTRAAQRFGQAVRAGRARADGEDLAFFAGVDAPDPAPFAGVAVVDKPAEAARALADLFPSTCSFDRAGAGAVALADGSAVVAVISSRRALELEPSPQRVAPGAQVRLAGTLPKGLAHPRLYVLGPGGAVEERPLPTSASRRFSSDLPLAARGEYAVEILADGPGGPQVLALRRIFAGIEPPDAPPRPASRGQGLASVEEAIGALRAARGLPPLGRDGALDAVAAAHSREMAAARTFAHVLPADGTMGDRLRKAGYAFRSAGENIGLAPDAVEAHSAIVGSPAHLANLLDPRHRRLGLGTARGLSPDGVPVVYLTEVLAAPVVGSRDPAGDVARFLEAERSRRGLPPLAREPALDAVALDEARALSMGGGPVLQRGTAAQRAIDAGLGLRSAAADLVVGTSPDEAASSNHLRDAAWTRVGVGALYATSPQYGPGRLWMVIVYGR